MPIRYEDLTIEQAELAWALWHDDADLTLDDAADLALWLEAGLDAYELAWDRDAGNLAAAVYAATGDPEAADTMFAALPF
jgi:hypothetical protein